MTPAAKKPDLCRISENAFTQVLNTLLPQSSAPGSPSTCRYDSEAREQITKSVLLAGPKLSGRVLVQVPKGFVAYVTHLLTGLDGNAAEAKGLLDDTAGELANMVAGCVASRLLQDGYACTLSTPSVSRNSLPSFELPPGIDRGGAELNWEGYRLAVEIQCQYAVP